MTRLTTASRWLLAAIFLALPGTVLASSNVRWSEVFEILVVFSPFVLAGLGLVFRVAAARGLGIGLGLVGLVAWGLGTGFDVPERFEQWVLLSQSLGLVLALPAFGETFGDSPRLRWTAAVMGVAIPTAAFFAVLHPGPAQALGWGAVALTGVGVIGLGFQRTWSLFVLLAAALVVGLAPLAVAPSPYLGCTSLEPPPELEHLAAGALALTWLPWIGPVVRGLRAPA
ncbi:MAG: hypothetical protein KC417_13530 [Myxococcales bacterium]|nr:hypothetical protein [Myxococcales bacterium]